ncbi:MAG: hypothetical protein ON057_001772 [Glomeribacter sp. 1016415]|nr:hypothetical protein [Glomeribacter sp. 1016415]
MFLKTVAVNDRGLRIGESHHMARLTNREVELIRDLHDEGMGYEALAEKFEISRWTVGRICRFECRAQLPTRYKKVHVPKNFRCRVMRSESFNVLRASDNNAF